MSKPWRAIQPRLSNGNILQNNALKPLKLHQSVGVDARYRNAKAYAITTFPLLMPGNVLWPSAQKRWQTRSDPLWWSAIAHKDLALNSTVRSWAARRVRMAFVASLKKRGWDANGRPLAGSGQAQPLYGTLQMAAAKASITVKIEQLAKDTDLIVEQIVQKQGNAPYWDVVDKSKSRKKR